MLFSRTNERDALGINLAQGQCLILEIERLPFVGTNYQLTQDTKKHKCKK